MAGHNLVYLEQWDNNQADLEKEGKKREAYYSYIRERIYIL